MEAWAATTRAELVRLWRIESAARGYCAAMARLRGSDGALGECAEWFRLLESTVEPPVDGAAPMAVHFDNTAVEPAGGTE